MSTVNIEAYIEKYQHRFFEGEAEAIRKNHADLYDTVRFIEEWEMPNECRVIYKGREIGYNAVVRMCPCIACGCRNVADCEALNHSCVNCRATCQ